MTTDTTSGRTDQMKQEGRRLTDEARSKGGEVGRKAKEEMGNVFDDARSRARDRADDQTHRAAGALRDMAGQLDSMADASSESGTMTDMAHSGADRIRRLADRLDERGIDGIVGDVQNFARRRPGAFIAAGVGAGMLLGRVLRSVDTDRLTHAVSGSEADSQPEPSSERGTDQLGGRSQPLTPEEMPEPITTRSEGPEAGRGI